MDLTTRLTVRVRELRETRTWLLLQWALMAAAIFWTLVFRLAAEAAKFPEFVYVNF